jgi:hypothetical protein
MNKTKNKRNNYIVLYIEDNIKKFMLWFLISVFVINLISNNFFIKLMTTITAISGVVILYKNKIR